MIWVLYALGSAITFSFISALDKVLLQRYIPNSRVFIIMVGFVQLLLAVCVLPLASFTGYGADDVAIAVGSGLVTGAYLILLFWAISLQDVSRVVPVASTYPIFVAILAQFFLGEELGVVAWTGICVTVAGVGLMSFGPTARASDMGKGQRTVFALLIAASLMFGLSQIMSKVVADDMDVWTLLMWRMLGAAAVCIALLVRPQVAPEIVRTLRNPSAMGLLLLTEGALVLVAMVLTLEAIYNGPVSLASTVMATRPLFVFGLGIVLSMGASNVLNEPLEGRILATKMLAIAMMVAGVGAVTLA